MSVEPFEAGVTAFVLVKTTSEWLGLSVEQRVEAFTTEVLPAINSKVKASGRGSSTRSSTRRA